MDNSILTLDMWFPASIKLILQGHKELEGRTIIQIMLLTTSHKLSAWMETLQKRGCFYILQFTLLFIMVLKPIRPKGIGQFGCLLLGRVGLKQSAAAYYGDASVNTTHTKSYSNFIHLVNLGPWLIIKHSEYFTISYGVLTLIIYIIISDELNCELWLWAVIVRALWLWLGEIHESELDHILLSSVE